MTSAGYKARVQLALSATAFLGEGMTDSGDGVRFFITDQTKNVLDPSASVTVYDGGVAVDAADYTVDHLSAQVTFSSAPAGAVTIDASAMDLLTFLKAREFTFAASRTLLDTTVFGDGSVKRTGGLADVNVTLTTLALANEDVDPGAATTLLSSLLTGGATVLLNITPTVDGPHRFRAWTRLESEEGSVGVGDLATLSVTAQGHLPDGATTVFLLGNPGA